MAVFIMAVGILSMVALYPLGLRESLQGQADIKQAMLADYLLNQAVGIASQTNITWTQWRSVGSLSPGSWPSFIQSKLKEPYWVDAPQIRDRYMVTCALVPGLSERVMGIMIQSTDMTKNYKQDGYLLYTNNPIFYAEVLFQGDASQ